LEWKKLHPTIYESVLAQMCTAIDVPARGEVCFDQKEADQNDQ